MKLCTENNYEFADYVYITVDNVGDESVEAVLSEYEKRSTIPHATFESRADGIKTALLESEPNDIICIVGRGNSIIQARSYNDIILYNDKDVVMKYIDILSD